MCVYSSVRVCVHLHTPEVPRPVLGEGCLNDVEKGRELRKNHHLFPGKVRLDMVELVKHRLQLGAPSRPHWCLRLCLCMHVCTYVCVSVFMYVCVSLSLSLTHSLTLSLSLSLSLCVCMCVCVCVCVSVYVGIFTYIRTHIHTHTLGTYIHIHSAARTTMDRSIDR